MLPKDHVEVYGTKAVLLLGGPDEGAVVYLRRALAHRGGLRRSARGTRESEANY